MRSDHHSKYYHEYRAQTCLDQNPLMALTSIEAWGEWQTAAGPSTLR